MILCAGEALIDMIPRQTAQGGTAFAPLAGGSVFNTAIALGRLGTPVQFFSGLSSDLFGDVLRKELTASKVDSSPAHISDRPTTLAFVTLTDGHASYAFYDENTAGRMIGQADLPVVQADAIFFGGISLVVEPCAAAYQALMLREAKTCVTMIDPNIRPGFITDEAAYRARLADMFKAQGVTVLTRDGAAEVPAVKATVVDTVGAGDTFSAGFLADLHKAGLLTKSTLPTATMHDLTRAAGFGARVAAITVARAGANPPWAAEL